MITIYHILMILPCILCLIGIGIMIATFVHLLTYCEPPYKKEVDRTLGNGEQWYKLIPNSEHLKLLDFIDWFCSSDFVKSKHYQGSIEANIGNVILSYKDGEVQFTNRSRDFLLDDSIVTGGLLKVKDNKVDYCLLINC